MEDTLQSQSSFRGKSFALQNFCLESKLALAFGLILPNAAVARCLYFDTPLAILQVTYHIVFARSYTTMPKIYILRRHPIIGHSLGNCVPTKPNQHTLMRFPLRVIFSDLADTTIYVTLALRLHSLVLTPC